MRQTRVRLARIITVAAVFCSIATTAGTADATGQNTSPAAILAAVTARSEKSSSYVLSLDYGRLPPVVIYYHAPNLVRTVTTTTDAAGKVRPLVVVYVGSTMYTSDIEHPGFYVRRHLGRYVPTPTSRAFASFVFDKFATDVTRHGQIFDFTFDEPGLSPGPGTATITNGYLAEVTFPAYTEGAVLGKSVTKFSRYDAAPAIGPPAPSKIEPSAP